MIPVGTWVVRAVENRRPPDVFIVVVDALRADRLGRGLTPCLDELATRGLRFANAYAASAWTRPSVASLFTGQLPSRHGIASFTAVLPESQVTLAEMLAASGYRTAGFSANPLVDSRNGSAQGFTHFENVGDGDPDPDAKIHAPRVFARVLAWLDTLSEPVTAPVAVYLHLMDVHGPYRPPEPHRSRIAGPVATVEATEPLVRRAREANRDRILRGDDRALAAITDRDAGLLEALYDGEVAGVDAALRDFIAALRERERLAHALVVVTADHGEEFHDHGDLTHGLALYDEVVHVPLLLWQTDVPRTGVVADAVSLRDLAATLLDLVGLPPAPTFDGASFATMPGTVVDPTAPRPFAPGHSILAELPPDLDSPRDMRRHVAAVVQGSTVLLMSPDGTLQAFDLATDPTQQRPLPITDLAGAIALRGALAGRPLRTPAFAAGPSVEFVSAVAARLRALGYVVP